MMCSGQPIAGAQCLAPTALRSLQHKLPNQPSPKVQARCYSSNLQPVCSRSCLSHITIRICMLGASQQDPCRHERAALAHVLLEGL